MSAGNRVATRSKQTIETSDDFMESEESKIVVSDRRMIDTIVWDTLLCRSMTGHAISLG